MELLQIYLQKKIRKKKLISEIVCSYNKGELSNFMMPVMSQIFHPLIYCEYKHHCDNGQRSKSCK
jgi:hypothetical protein